MRCQLSWAWQTRSGTGGRQGGWQSRVSPSSQRRDRGGRATLRESREVGIAFIHSLWILLYARSMLYIATWRLLIWFSSIWHYKDDFYSIKPLIAYILPWECLVYNNALFLAFLYKLRWWRIEDGCVYVPDALRGFISVTVVCYILVYKHVCFTTYLYIYIHASIFSIFNRYYKDEKISILSSCTPSHADIIIFFHGGQKQIFGQNGDWQPHSLSLFEKW